MEIAAGPFDTMELFKVKTKLKMKSLDFGIRPSKLHTE